MKSFSSNGMTQKKKGSASRVLCFRNSAIPLVLLLTVAIITLAGCGTTGQTKAAKVSAQSKTETSSKKAISRPKPATTATGEMADNKEHASDEKSPPTPEPGNTESDKRQSPSESGLKAGYADDNKQYNYFVNFLQKYAGQAQHLPLDISERIRVEVLDKNRKPAGNIELQLTGDGKPLVKATTYPDGSFYFFPSEPAFKKFQKFEVSVTEPGHSGKLTIARSGKRNYTLTLKSERQKAEQVPVDIVFVFDTTASMGEEIARLKNTIELIELNINSLTPTPKLRFGMVLYKDKEDEYNTKVVPLTENMAQFREELNKVEAGGGGDLPENLQDALKDTMALKWNPKGVRLAFIITDAAPHLDYDQKYTYVDAMKDARNRGIKFFSIGTGGLDINGEYVLRQIAQYTYGKYIFLTYGEKGESAGGKTGSVSHHTGEQFTADKLESIIIRFTKEEISYLSDKPLEKANEYFAAAKISGEEREKTLQALFDKALLQITDYSSVKLKDGITMAVLPIKAQKKDDQSTAEYFGEQVLIAGKKSKTFKVVERKNLQAILKELELQQSGIIDEGSAAKIGKLTEAELLLLGQMYSKDEYELFLKLIRVETGEVLAVTKARIDRKLGLGK